MKKFLQILLFLITAGIITANAQTPTLAYGTPDFDPKPGLTGVSYSSSNLAVATIVAGKVHIVGAGGTTITGTFNGQSSSRAIIVNKASLTITANNLFGLTSHAPATLTVSYTGFVNGDTPASLITQPIIGTAAKSSSPTGRYPITVSGASAANYNITYINGTYTLVSQSFINAALPVKTYGDPDFYVFGVPTSGISYSSSNPSIAIVSAEGKVHITGGGYYNYTTITVAFGGSQISKILFVHQAILTVTLNNEYGIVGHPIPAFTFSYSGFVYNDTPDSLIKKPIADTAYIPFTNPGLYGLLPSGALSNGYQFNYVYGELTLFAVLPTNAVIPVKTYGDPDFPEYGFSTVGINYSSNNPAVATIVNGNIHITGAGTSVITDTIEGHQIIKTLTVNPYALTAIIGSAGRPIGASNPPFKISYFGFVNGDSTVNLINQPKFSTTATASSPAGTYPITASGASSVNYTFTYVPGILRVSPAIPVISYTAPPGFTEGDEITALTPVSTGGAVPATIYGQTTTLAGSGSSGSANGTGTAASFSSLGGVCVDALSNVYVTDAGTIRKITPTGVVTNLAQTYGANGIAVDAIGNVYDAIGSYILKINPLGQVTTLAGNNKEQSIDGQGTNASFSNATSVALDGVGNIYVADAGQLRKIIPGGYVSTLKIDTGIYSYNSVLAVVANQAGNVYTTDGSAVYKLIPAGLIKIATVNTGSIYYPTVYSLTVDSAGNLYASAGNLIYQVTPAGKIHLVAGDTKSGSVNGIGATATFKSLTGVAFDPSGNLYVADAGNYLVRKVCLTGYDAVPALPPSLNLSATGVISGTPSQVFPLVADTVTAYNSAGGGSAMFNISVANLDATSPNIYTIAGNGTFGNTGNGGPAIQAEINNPYAMARDTKGNIYFTTSDGYIKKIDAVTHNIAIVAGDGRDGGYPIYEGPALYMGFAFGDQLPGLAVDSAGDIYVGDWGDNLIRRIDATTQMVTTIAGNNDTIGYGGDGGPAKSAKLSGPGGILLDAKNNIYFSDENNERIRRIDAKTLVITTVAGNGKSGYGGDGGFATDAPIDLVERITMDKAGNLYIAEEALGVVRRVDATTQIITTVAGSESNGYSGDGGPATSAQFGGIMGITFDAQGNLYISDQIKNVIRRVDGGTGIISTYAGTGVAAYNGDGSPSIDAALNFQTDIIADNAGNLFITDFSNDAIRRVGGTSALDPASQIIADNIAVNDAAGPKVNPAVSPNGDGINDVLTISNIEKYPSNKLMLMDASGAKIFESSNYDNVNKMFDGHSSLTGAMMPRGTYFYVLQYADGTTVKTKTGYIVLKY